MLTDGRGLCQKALCNYILKAKATILQMKNSSDKFEEFMYTLIGLQLYVFQMAGTVIEELLYLWLYGSWKGGFSKGLKKEMGFLTITLHLMTGG